VDSLTVAGGGWMEAVDGTIGRRLPALVGRSPLQVRQVHAEVLVEQAFASGALGFTLARGVVAMAARSGRFTAAELDAWLASLQAASARGEYLFSVNDYVVVATREPEEATPPSGGLTDPTTLGSPFTSRVPAEPTLTAREQSLGGRGG
jgi:hypothetical protein